MYRGFNLIIPEEIDKNYSKKGKELKERSEKHFKDSLKDFFIYDDIIDGNKVIEKWFPIIDCDIFISHSHQDEEKAINSAQ